MQLKAALSKIQEDSLLSGLSVIMLSGHENPLMFLTTFYQRLRNIEIEVTFLDTESFSFEDCKSQFEMSFLGMRRLYILKHFSSMDAEAKKKWHTYLERYEGPHVVLFFDCLEAVKKDKDESIKQKVLGERSTHLLIEIPGTIDIGLYKEIFSYFYPAVSINPNFVTALFSAHSELTLDDACRCMSYQTVVGRHWNSFFDSWISKLIVSETSLFLLSETFFAKNPKKFFKLWKGCKETYPVEFWIAYWSEQLWQAVQYIQRVRQFGIVEAKKNKHRLPFSFMNVDYKKHSQISLSQAHDLLYTLDYCLKNGADSAGLELWYHKFLVAQ